MSSVPSVLIARLDDTKSIYAIEHDSRNRYVFFKLASPVDLNKIYSVAVVTRLSTSRPGSRAASVSTRGGDDACLDQKSQFEGPKFSKKKKLDIEAIQSMVRRKSATGDSQIDSIISSTPLPAAVAPDASAETPSQLYIPASQEAPLVQPGPTPEEVLENIRSQYLENLYLSKASTAYFAKGPLSRARATYQLDIDSTFEMDELIGFLKSLVLPTTTLDKKYRDGVTEAVSKIESGGGSDVGLPGKAPRKKRAPKKIKLAKNGLYTNEDALIQKWWENYDNSLEVPGTSRESVTRSRISQLRIRETQLQMIVILEALQLEKMALPAQAELAGDLPAAEVKAEEKEKIPVKKTKAKKPQDLSALINILVDRLAIWQSVSAEESKGAVESVEEVDDADKPTGITDKHAADILKDYCVEVIVPFYAAKLPSICDAICRKLGGPKIVPSARPPMKKSATIANPASRPGAATKRAPPRVSEAPTLERLMTEERAQSRLGSRGVSRAASLMRSATMPGVKREKSETPSLSRIPSMESQPLSRNGVQNAKKHREVDMSFSSLINPVFQKANIDIVKKDAIEALRKPNRQLAGKTLMEELTERKAAAAANQSRKAKKPVRNALFDGVRSQGVQIQATPKGNRHNDMMAEPRLPQMYRGSHGDEHEREPSIILPTSVSRVPSSGSRLGGRRAEEPAILKATPLKRRVEPIQRAMIDTPVRSLSLSRTDLKQSITATPARATSYSHHGSLQAAGASDIIVESPARLASSRQLFKDHLQRGGLGAPLSPSPPQRQSTVKDDMGPPVSLKKNIFETPQKLKETLPSTPEPSNKPLKPLDFGRARSKAVSESPGAPLAVISQAVAPQSSPGEDLYGALLTAWNEEDDL